MPCRAVKYETDFLQSEPVSTHLCLPGENHNNFDLENIFLKAGLTSAMFREEPAGDTHQEHDHNHGLVLQISNNVHFDAAISSLNTTPRIRLHNLSVVSIVVLAWVVGRESIHLAQSAAIQAVNIVEQKATIEIRGMQIGWNSIRFTTD